MNIDLTKLMTNEVEEIPLDIDVEMDEERFKTTSIRKLKDVKFQGEITRTLDGIYQISGKLFGEMILPDDVTLADVAVNFSSDIEENFHEFGDMEEKRLEINQNRLDITEFLWQNILVEIPLKVRAKGNENLTLKGDGWRLVTEEELEKGNNSPFSELSKIFDSRKE